MYGGVNCVVWYLYHQGNCTKSSDPNTTATSSQDSSSAPPTPQLTMTDHRSEALLLKHYRLDSAFPEAWSDPIEDLQIAQRKQFRASTTRYSILQEEGISASFTRPDADSGFVPEDEPDPLGSTSSVVRLLRDRGLPLEENTRLRNRYLISSKTFSPTAFLRDVHATTPSSELQRGLNLLSGSIAQKSGSLKLLVESNFDRFVAAKGTIEGVYKEMKANSFLDKDKESEYGVGKIRSYLNEAEAKADDVFGPVMKGRGREEELRTLLSVVERHRDILEIPGLLNDCIKRKDYESLIDEYQKARKALMDARALVPTEPGSLVVNFKEEHIHQLIIAEKMWIEITFAIDDFKRDTWKRLAECRTEDNLHMELIGILLELGVEDNPIWVWLLSRYEYLKNRITTVFERSRVEIEGLSTARPIFMNNHSPDTPSPPPKGSLRTPALLQGNCTPSPLSHAAHPTGPPKTTRYLTYHLSLGAYPQLPNSTS